MGPFLIAGWSVLVLTAVAVLLLLVATVRFLLRWNAGYTDVPFATLLVASFLGLPVILYENLIFIHLYVKSLPFQPSNEWLQLTFLFSAIGVVFYNLYLLSVKDFPIGSIALLSFLVGISIGGMVPSLHLDLGTVRVVYYDPIEGGYLFAFGILLFNFIGLVGFVFALLEMDPQAISQVGWITFVAILSFMLGPFVVILERLFDVLVMPLNFVFIPFLLSSILHMGNYVIRLRTLPVLGSVEYILVISKDDKTPLASYPTEVPEFLPFLSSMDQLRSLGKGQPRPIFFGSDEVEVLLTTRQLTGLVMLKGSGNRIGRICLARLLSCLEKREPIDFELLVRRCFYPFFVRA